MFKNYFYLNRLVIELNPILKDFKLVDCFSQEKDKLVLHFRKNDEEKFLILSADQNAQHILLRNEFQKARKNYINFLHDSLPLQFQKIEIAKDDRIIKFSLTSSNLFYFIRGKETNILFTSPDKSYSTFKKIKKGIIDEISNGIEEKNYSLDYNSPDLKLFDDSKISLTDISKKWPFISKEIIQEVKLRHSIDKSFFNILLEVISEINTNRICIFKDDNTGKIVFVPDSFRIYSSSEKKCFDSTLDAVKYLFFQKYKNDNIEDYRKLISRILNNQLQKTSDKLNEIKYKLEQPSKEELYRKQANILLANINLIKKGMEEINLEDFSEKGNYYKIKLDKTLTANGNIEYYYEKAKNEKVSRKQLLELSDELKKKFNRLKELNEKFIQSQNIDDFKDIMDELKIKSSKQENSKIIPPHFKHYLIDDKYNVYVGKDSKNNDELTTKFAKQNDYWFHARAVSGSHVVLRVENTKEGIPKSILKKSASIAAYHSKAKTSKLAPVSYSLKKYVVKRKGMETGKVSMLKEDVLLVEPIIPTGCKYINDD